MVISLQEAKTHLKVLHAAEDELINSLILAATAWAEDYTNRALISRSVKQNFGAFCCYMPLELVPVSEIERIEYYDEKNDTQVLSTDIYQLSDDKTDAQVLLKPKQVWPKISENNLYPITVYYKAGAAAIDERYRAAIKLLVGYLYENREDAPVKDTETMPRASKYILNGLKIWRT